jgi:proteic killer suppression protein
MRVIFEEKALARMDSEVAFTGGFPPMVVGAYRGRIQVIRAAPEESAMHQLRSLQMEQDGEQPSVHSIRVTDEWDLIVAFQTDADGKRLAVVKSIVERKRKNTRSLP